MSNDRPDSELNLTGLMQDGLRELIELVGSSGVTELHIERGETKLHIKSAPRGVQAPAQPEHHEHLEPLVAALPQPVSTTMPAAAPSGTPITSPIVGTYYSAPNPQSDPFVRVGERVEVGQTVGIVEAMKMMNEIESEIAGRVVEILVENGQAVEYGQPLMLVDTGPGSA